MLYSALKNGGSWRGKGDCSVKPEGYILSLHENRVFEYVASFHGGSVECSVRTGHHEKLRNYNKVFYFFKVILFFWPNMVWV